MNSHVSKLKLKAYSGRENGLMVVGDVDTLKALGAQLLAVDATSRQSSSEFPPVVARPETNGPYEDVDGFQLTFHLDVGQPIKGNGIQARRNMPPLLLLAVAVCAIVGAATIARWLISYAN
jgi:hypothetical protein